MKSLRLSEWAPILSANGLRLGKKEARRDAIYLQYAPELETAMREAGLLNTPRVWQVTITPEILAQIHHLHEMLPNSAQPGVIEQIDLAAMSLFE